MRKVLIVVDMLNDFIDENGKLCIGPNGQEIVEPIEAKIDEAREKGYDVIHICDAHETDDKEFDRFPEHSVRGTWGAMVIDRLTPTKDDFVIEKQRYSGFFSTELERLLLELDPEEVEVVGCCTSICVAQTVADLANRDYKIVVDRAAVADFNEDAHNFYLDYQLPNIFGVEIVD